MNILSRLWIAHQLREQFYHWNVDTLRQHQAERVAWILSQAREHSPYYRRILHSHSDFSSIPKINKAEMMSHFDEINTAGLCRDDLVQFRIQQERQGKLELYPGEFSVGLSSGTSGGRGLSVLSKVERQMYGCMLWTRSGIPEGVWRPRVLFALRTNNPSFMEPRSFGVKLVYVDYTHPTEELVRLICAKKLNILAGPPSLLAMIARHRNSITHHIEALISYAEVLDDDTRAYLVATFESPVAQIYQGAEGFIASTCRCGKLHLNEDTILVETEEVSAEDSSVKKVIVTDLYRTTQPIIRYSLDDVLEFDPEPCACGSCFRVIQRIHGRADDIFLLKNAAGETCYLFPDYVRRSINQASDEILEYQAIQHTPDSIEIRLVLKPGSKRAAIEQIVQENLKWRMDRLGAQPIHLRFSTELPERNPRSYKLIRVVRKFK